MIAQLRSELLKQRTTRATGALLLWMLVLIVVIVLLHSFGLSASSLRVAGNQPKVYGWGTSIGALLEFKGSSQHRLVGLSIGTRRGPRRGSSSRGSCGGGRSGR